MRTTARPWLYACWLVLSALLTSCARLGPPEPASAPDSRDGGEARIQVEASRTRRWASSCEDDFCEAPVLLAVDVTIPTGWSRVTVSASLTLDYSITEGDQGFAYAQLVSGDGSARSTMLPGSYRVASSGSGEVSSTTLVWLLRTTLEAQSDHTIEVSPQAVDADNNGNALFSGRRAVLVVEITSP